MLLDEVILGCENGHPGREFWENVLFFNGMVDGEMLAELDSLGEKRADGHARRTGTGGAAFIKDVPDVAKMVVLGDISMDRREHDQPYVGVHHDCETVVYPEVSGGQLCKFRFRWPCV